ncbi:hypothetical protein I4F81_011922 [Pyropia yezoensis]|uniref:Uncharacterized protein n=1 Tax=Pyropia yezoensis TaxID=2788 RepID=A0ACC3CGQ1_PYRYE|nr:hypothetical protein I4F81_011922 [Neopyropia yezoensis]
MAESRGTVGRLRFPAGLEAVAPREQDVLSAHVRVGGGREEDDPMPKQFSSLCLQAMAGNWHPARAPRGGIAAGDLWRGNQGVLVACLPAAEPLGGCVGATVDPGGFAWRTPPAWGRRTLLGAAPATGGREDAQWGARSWVYRLGGGRRGIPLPPPAAPPVVEAAPAYLTAAAAGTRAPRCSAASVGLPRAPDLPALWCRAAGRASLSAWWAL